MEKKRLSLGRRLAFYLIGFGIIFLLMITVGELLVRAMVFFRSRTYPTYTTVTDRTFGSRAIENFVWNGVVKDIEAQPYPLHFTTNALGFRMFGDTAGSRKKVLFIGDSFTHAIEVSDDKTYFALLADSLNFECFAYGCRGYNTVQEWMFVEKYAPIIRPDVVVLQFCSNDFVNNHYELERNSIYNNNRRARPYLLPDDRVVFNVPAKVGLQWLSDRFMLFDLIFTRTERLLDNNRPKEKTTEYQIEQHGAAYPPLAESIRTTERLLARFRDALEPETRFLVFNVDGPPPFFEALQGICERQQIPFVGTIPKALDEQAAQGHTIWALDGAHWNEAGHQIAAQSLMDSLRVMLKPEQIAEATKDSIF